MPVIYKPKTNSSNNYSKGLYTGEQNNSINGNYKIISGRYCSNNCGYGVLDSNSRNNNITSTINTMSYGELVDIEKNILKRDYHGDFKPIPYNSLRNKSVAFYFASYDNAKCRSFTPFLTQFYKSINSSAPINKIEIILVSLDKDEEKFHEHTRHIPFAIVDYNSDLRKQLIKRYDIKEDPELSPNVLIPITGLPKLLIVGEHGEKLHWLSCDNHSQTILREWDFHAFKWS